MSHQYDVRFSITLRVSAVDVRDAREAAMNLLEAHTRSNLYEPVEVALVEDRTDPRQVTLDEVIARAKAKWPKAKKKAPTKFKKWPTAKKTKR